MDQNTSIEHTVYVKFQTMGQSTLQEYVSLFPFNLMAILILDKTGG